MKSFFPSKKCSTQFCLNFHGFTKLTTQTTHVLALFRIRRFMFDEIIQQKNWKFVIIHVLLQYLHYYYYFSKKNLLWCSNNCHEMGPFIVSQSMWGRRTTPSRGGGAMLPKKISLLWENFINLGVFHRVIYDRIRN